MSIAQVAIWCCCRLKSCYIKGKLFKTLCMLGSFSCFCRLLTIFEINATLFTEMIVLYNGKTEILFALKQIIRKPHSRKVTRDWENNCFRVSNRFDSDQDRQNVGPPFAKVINRRQKWPQARTLNVSKGRDRTFNRDDVWKWWQWKSTGNRPVNVKSTVLAQKDWWKRSNRPLAGYGLPPPQGVFCGPYFSWCPMSCKDFSTC